MTRLSGAWGRAEGERDGLHETVAAADADRDRLEAQVAALQRELADHREALKQAQVMAADYALKAIDNGKNAEQAERELTEAKQAVYNARASHVREAHPTRLIDGNCYFCRVFTAIDREMPSRPDDPEEIQRLAQATTEETNDG
jgi:chromosome segregation ATPase